MKTASEIQAVNKINPGRILQLVSKSCIPQKSLKKKTKQKHKNESKFLAEKKPFKFCEFAVKSVFTDSLVICNLPPNEIYQCHMHWDTTDFSRHVLGKKLEKKSSFLATPYPHFSNILMT